MATMSEDSPAVIVTGCSKGGIGFSLCEESTSKGCKVYATARRVETMQAFKHENIKCLKLDVTDAANVQDVVKTVLEREGRIDVLVNNAGSPCIVLRMVKAIFPHMAVRKSGTIVNIGSMVGDITTPWDGVYAASKAATVSISETLYMECAPFNISVVHIAPGGIRSNISKNTLSSFSLPRDSFYSGWIDSIISRIHLSQRGGSMPSEEFARTVVKAVLQPRPPRYMTLGSGSRLFALFKWLPRGFMLWMFWRKFGANFPTAKGG